MCDKLWVLACNFYHLVPFWSYIILAVIIVAALRSFIKPQLSVLILLLLLIMAVTRIMLDLLLIVSYIPLSYLGKRYCKQFFREGNEFYEPTDYLSNKYAVILISNNQSSSMIKCCIWRYWKNSMVDATTVFIPLLVKHFQKNNLNYKIIQSITKEDFNDNIKEPDCEEVYLMGHGSRSRFKLSEITINYSEYVNIKTKKRIVSQLHCNGIKCREVNTSLTELLATNQKDSFINKRTNGIVDLFYYCWKMSRK